MAISIRGILLDALAVLSPVDCAGCGSPDRALCERCRVQLQPAVTPRTLPDGSMVFTALRYEGVARTALLAFKEGGRTDIARTLGTSLSAALERAAEPQAEFVAVPSGRSARRRRGYDPVAVLCRKAGVTPSSVLRMTRSTPSQKTLGAAGRAHNLHESMSARGALHGRRFILVDDVVTTGASLTEAARAVHAAGGEVVGRAALAFTPRLFGN
jgi:ComF family protein